MSDHPNVETVNSMTEAIFSQDHDALAKIFTDDLVFHLRGPDPMAGDHAGEAPSGVAGLADPTALDEQQLFTPLAAAGVRSFELDLDRLAAFRADRIAA